MNVRERFISLPLSTAPAEVTREADRPGLACGRPDGRRCAGRDRSAGQPVARPRSTFPAPITSVTAAPGSPSQLVFTLGQQRRQHRLLPAPDGPHLLQCRAAVGRGAPTFQIPGGGIVRQFALHRRPTSRKPERRSAPGGISTSGCRPSTRPRAVSGPDPFYPYLQACCPGPRGEARRVPRMRAATFNVRTARARPTNATGWSARPPSPPRSTTSRAERRRHPGDVAGSSRTARTARPSRSAGRRPAC